MDLEYVWRNVLTRLCAITKTISGEFSVARKSRGVRLGDAIVIGENSEFCGPVFLYEETDARTSFRVHACEGAADRESWTRGVLSARFTGDDHVRKRGS